jgi:hypothetical protein
VYRILPEAGGQVNTFQKNFDLFFVLSVCLIIDISCPKSAINGHAQVHVIGVDIAIPMPHKDKAEIGKAESRKGMEKGPRTTDH